MLFPSRLFIASFNSPKPTSKLSHVFPFMMQQQCSFMQAKGSFTIVLSGGSLLKALVKLVDNPGVDWSKWHVAYADERNVPHSSDDSNHKGAKEAFLEKVNLPHATARTCQLTLSLTCRRIAS